MLDAASLSRVFASLQDGSLSSRLAEFSDEQLEPLLPLLITTAYVAHDDDDSGADSLSSRLMSVRSANAVLALASLDFLQLQEELEKEHGSDSGMEVDSVHASFLAAAPRDKFRILCDRIAEYDPDQKQIYAWPGVDEVPLASHVLSLVALRMPSLLDDSLLLSLVGWSNAGEILTRLCLNCPSLLPSLLDGVLSLEDRDDSARGKQRCEVLHALLLLSPCLAAPSIRSLLSRRRDCQLGVRLAAALLPQEQLLEMIGAELADRESAVCQVLHRSSARVALAALAERLVKEMEKEQEQEKEKEQGCSPPTRLLLTFVQLHLGCNLRPGPIETEQLVSSVCSRSFAASQSHLALQLAALVATPLIVMPPSMSASSSASNERAVGWLRWLSETGGGGGGASLAVQQLLYLAICVCAGRQEQLVGTLVGVLGTKVVVGPRHMAALKTMFTAAGLDERTLAERMIRQPVTPNLTASAPSHRLPVDSVLQLLHAGAFGKGRGERRQEEEMETGEEEEAKGVGQWLSRQLASCGLPVHPAMGEAIEKCARLAAEWREDSAFSGDGGGEGGGGGWNEFLLDKRFVKDTFSGPLLCDDRVLARRVLVAVYLLVYRQHAGKRDAYAEEGGVYTTMPLRYLGSVVEVRPSAFSAVRSRVAAAVAEQCPHMLPTTDSQLLAAGEGVGRGGRVEMGEKQVRSILCGADHSAALRLLRRIDTAQLSEQVRLLDPIIAASVSCLSPACPAPLVEAVTRQWHRLEHIVPRLLIERSAMAWQDPACARVTCAAIYDQPSLLFRVRPDMLTSPRHFGCFVMALAFFVEAGRTELRQAVAVSKADDEAARGECEMLQAALEHTHTSLVVQLLIEVADEKRTEGAPSSSARIREIRRLAADYIHQLFIADRQLMKLVMFQTFPLHMVPAMVSSVPSMFACVDWVHEMLSLPDMNRRLFAVALIAAIGEKYRVASSAQTCELVLDVLHCLAHRADSADALWLTGRTVPVMRQLIGVFPHLSSEVVSILMRSASMCRARLAMRATTIHPSCEEKKLLKEIEKAIEEGVTRGLGRV